MAVRVSKVTRNKGGKGGVIDPAKLKDGLDNQLKELAAIIKEQMFGILDKGSKHKIKRDSKGLYNDTKVTFNTDGVIIKTGEYAQNLDKGRRKGLRKVPIKNIIAWIKRYRVGGRNSRTGKFQKVNNVNNLAYAIQTSIYKNGIKARPFLARTLDFAEQVIQDAIENIIYPDIISILDFLPRK